LEAMARQAKANSGIVATSYDAQRGQIFAGLYKRSGETLEAVSGEMVIEAAAFLELAGEHCAAEKVTWVSLDPELLTSAEGWKKREVLGEAVLPCEPWLADAIGELAEECAKKGKFTDALLLDANYVRRSDAEIFWKGPASHVR
jgi:tRNA A37 threonylcarbamoyladenosine modification protein TsaB